MSDRLTTLTEDISRYHIVLEDANTLIAAPCSSTGSAVGHRDKLWQSACWHLRGQCGTGDVFRQLVRRSDIKNSFTEKWENWTTGESSRDDGDQAEQVEVRLFVTSHAGPRSVSGSLPSPHSNSKQGVPQAHNIKRFEWQPRGIEAYEIRLPFVCLLDSPHNPLIRLV